MDLFTDLELTTPAGNASLFAAAALGSNVTARRCAPFAPTSRFMLKYMPTSVLLLVIGMLLLTLITLAIYIEEIIFISKAFRISVRRKKTIWILAFYPVFSVCSFVGIIVPKAGPFVHMCANLYFCTCLYHILRLIIHYMGGSKNIWALVERGRRFRANTLPLCCCCVCLPRPVFHPLNFLKITLLVLQVVIIRPLVIFIMAVLWADGFRATDAERVFATGEYNPRRGFLWLLAINVLSTCTAVYGLMLLCSALEPELQRDFQVRGKIASIQVTLIMTVIPNLIIGLLVSRGVIHCNPLLPAKAVGEEIYFCTIIVMMLPFSLIGRKFFRQISDGHRYASSQVASLDSKAPHVDEKSSPPSEQKEDPLGDTSKCLEGHDGWGNGNGVEKMNFDGVRGLYLLDNGDESIV